MRFNKITPQPTKSALRAACSSALRAPAAIGLLFALFALLPAVPAHAQEAVLQLDPAKSTVEFTLGDVLHTVHGSFKLRSGSIHFDLTSGKAGGEVIVDATSGESGNSSRDRKMHAEVLQSEKYPEITFAPAEVSGHVAAEGDSQIELRGDFQLHGESHEISVRATVHIDAPRGNDSAGAELTSRCATRSGESKIRAPFYCA
jgi:polyisoprenoid-binding protein YceI